ncbi:MAG: 30S ribosomal protein S2 [bacterium]|nr:30S ribosomal protein S2 [bacterium]
MAEEALQLNYEDMLKAGMHFGRKKTVFNPKMEKYVFTVKEGICIIDLLKTQVEIKKVVEYLKKVIGDGGMVLFVGLTKQSADTIKALALEVNMPYVVDRWLGGTLTNFKVISGRTNKLEEMEKQQKSGELDKYTKKERLLFERELKKMENHFGGLRKMTRLPDVVFVSSSKESELPIREAKRMKIKTIAITNTDSSPDDVDYAIPANDRSKKSVDLILDAIKNELISK